MDLLSQLVTNAMEDYLHVDYSKNSMSAGLLLEEFQGPSMFLVVGLM